MKIAVWIIAKTVAAIILNMKIFFFAKNVMKSASKEMKILPIHLTDRKELEDKT